MLKLLLTTSKFRILMLTSTFKITRFSKSTLCFCPVCRNLLCLYGVFFPVFFLFLGFFFSFFLGGGGGWGVCLLFFFFFFGGGGCFFFFFFLFWFGFFVVVFAAFMLDFSDFRICYICSDSYFKLYNKIKRHLWPLGKLSLYNFLRSDLQYLSTRSVGRRCPHISFFHTICVKPCEDPGWNRSSTFPSDETGKTKVCVAAGVAR
jgi:hypothetical protein